MACLMSLASHDYGRPSLAIHQFITTSAPGRTLTCITNALDYLFKSSRANKFGVRGGADRQVPKGEIR